MRVVVEVSRNCHFGRVHLLVLPGPFSVVVGVVVGVVCIEYYRVETRMS